MASSSVVPPATAASAAPAKEMEKLVRWFDLPAHVSGIDKLVSVRLTHVPGQRRNNTDIYVKNRRTKEQLRKFRTIPTFLKHYIPKAQCFHVREFIDKKRKQWGYECQHTAGTVPKTNPRIHEQTCATPPEVYAFMRDVWKLTVAEYDPCPVNHTVCGLSRHWKVDEPEKETVYINPPYKDCERWVKKTLHEIRKGRIHSAAMLLPIRGYSQWFNRLVLPYASKITTADGGIRFVGFDKIYPWGNIMVLFKRKKVMKRREAIVDNGVDDATLKHPRMNSYRFHPKSRPTKRKRTSKPGW